MQFYNYHQCKLSINIINIIIISIIKLFIITDGLKQREFRIDYPNDQFLKDGQPFRYVSGSLHYFRVPSVLWTDRLAKARLAGLNAIQTYVEWSSHEPEEGVYDFEGDNDLLGFIRLANQSGLLVILRTGPFIDAERDMGGLPYWLLAQNPKMGLRSSEPSYLAAIDKWYGLLLPKLRPLLYRNGGPLIMVQIENEYGSYPSCDYSYLNHLRQLHHKYLASDTEVVYFTTDGAGDGYLKCGKMDGIFATVDFGVGTDASEAFQTQHRHQEMGPNVNSEYYTGWLDHWEHPHETVATGQVVDGLDKMLALNASVNLYMFHGGTSFGFRSGSNVGQTFDVCPTSYDYDSPLDESGDPTDKYYAIRETIKKYLPLPNGTVPQPRPKMQLPPIQMLPVLNMYDLLANQTAPVRSDYPQSFEQLRQSHGFVLYSTTINQCRPSDPAVLTINGLADRAHVFVDKRYAGTVSRTQKLYELGLDIEYGQQLDILVENQGRPCYGNDIKELKGIIGNVTLGPVVLTDWLHYLLFRNWSEIVDIVENHGTDTVPAPIHRLPAFFTSKFQLPANTTRGQPLDTFLRLSSTEGWHKGQAFLNGFNLGRYWPSVGPQLTLYTPRHLFRPYPQLNRLTLWELEWSLPTTRSSSSMTVQFVSSRILNGTTPYASYTTTNNNNNKPYDKYNNNLIN